jgi:hypothetical protein
MKTSKYYIFLTLFLTLIPIVVFPSSTTIIHHQVFLWLKNNSGKTIDKIIYETNKLRTIPGIIDLNVGTVVSSERNIVDDSYHIGIHMTFESVADMKVYLQHRDHQEYLRVYVKPILEKIRVYDFSETTP